MKTQHYIIGGLAVLVVAAGFFIVKHKMKSKGSDMPIKEDSATPAPISKPVPVPVTTPVIERDFD